MMKNSNMYSFGIIITKTKFYLSLLIMEGKQAQERIYYLKDYTISLDMRPSTILITVQQQNSQNTWRANFSSHFIEELTSKTGNFKKFQVFLKMLISGFEKTSQSVVLDVLTQDEFDQIRNDAKSRKEPKLLLIMTYLVEFDRVHYPLPLPLCQNTQIPSKISPLRNLQVENLQNELKELKNIQKQKDAMEARLELLLSERDKQLYYLNKEKEELQSELDKIKDQMDSIIEQLEEQALGNSTKEQKQVEDMKKQKEKVEHEVEKYKRENKGLREEAKKDKSRIIQLESELKSLFDKTTSGRAKSFSGITSVGQKRSSNYHDSSEINQKISHLKILLDRAKSDAL